MADRARVLLTVSGVVAPDLDETTARGERPRADYRVLGHALAADVVDVGLAKSTLGRFGSVLHRFAGAGPILAWYCFTRRRDYDIVLTDGEQVGLPFAILCRLLGKRSTFHAMIVHVVSPPKKALLITALRLAPMIDLWLVYATSQQHFIQRQFGVPASRISLTPFMVDSAFFSPDAVSTERRRMICAVGLERRDYPTLMEAVRDLDVEVVIAAGSPWSKWSDSSAGVAPPPNVEVSTFTQAELRDLYAQSAFTVMPLDAVDFQAGITAILEAMSMERAVVCTLTEGQTDTITDGVNGRYVPPGDVDALRLTISELLDDQPEADRLGRNGRAWILEHGDVDIYAARVASALTACAATAS